MYENGGNTIQRHLDGHTQLFSYPFESQVGNKGISDYLSTFVPHKYRWPQFQLGDSIEQMYESIWDEEVKIRVKTPHMSKFKEANIQLKDSERKAIFKKLLDKKEITRRNVIESFFMATNSAWKNYNRSGKESIYVGYNPVQILDFDKIIEDFQDGIILHIVRNPYSAYAETKHRPAPLGLRRYIDTWSIVQLFALNAQAIYPKNVVIVRFEDLVANPEKFFRSLAKKLGIKYEKTMLYPSWNGIKLENMYPWGTIQLPTVEYNQEKMKELSSEEYKTIKKLTSIINEKFNYQEL